MSLVSSYTASKYRLQYTHYWHRHSVSLGGQYLLNSRVHDLDSDQYFKRRFYATKSSQRLGASLTYSFELVRVYSIPIQISYDFQFVRSDLLGDRFEPTVMIDGVQFYQYQKQINPVTIAIENICGLGFEIPISKKIFLTQKAGWGIVSFYGIDRSIRQQISREYDFSFLLYAGLGYKF